MTIYGLPDQSSSSARRRRCCTRSRHGAFSLIELMVVFGIIIIVFTTFGVAMRPSGGKNVRLGQNSVAGLYTVARLQAKTTQGNGRLTDSDAARIIIYASKQDDNDLARYLRQIQVVVPDPTDPNNKWMTVGEIVTLPAG